MKRRRSRRTRAAFCSWRAELLELHHREILPVIGATADIISHQELVFFADCCSSFQRQVNAMARLKSTC